MKTLHVAVACRNASGMPDMPVFTVTVTDEEYELGIHYDKAEALADEEGYEEPFISYDYSEQKAIKLAVRTLQALSRAAG